MSLIESARDEAERGRQLSGQAAYNRRQPEAASLEHFRRAHDMVDEILRLSPGNLDALVLGSFIAECMLDYARALSLHEQALKNGLPKDKKSLRRLADLQGYASEWESLGLSPEELMRLGKYLNDRVDPNDVGGLKLTEKWLQQTVPDRTTLVIQGLNARGAFDDFQVLSNVVQG